MDDYTENFLEEEKRLEYTVSEIKKQLGEEEQQLVDRKRHLAEFRRDMWEDAGYYPTDFGGIAQISQYRAESIVQTETYLGNLARVERYKRMVDNPYFGRFDFQEEGQGDREEIYVGLGTFVDSDSFNVLVYDWRAPISSIFYRNELGPAEYEAPSGTQKGEILLKRQYKIHKGKLLNFFDSGIVIRDEMLQEILSRNSSIQMRTIVESIQKEQDIVIRDNSHGLVIVQGAAGSGKTSIALHRVAYLLYEGLDSRLSSRNILILSPNQVFSQYIASVLPDLGEENVEQITFDTIAGEALEGLTLETRSGQLERIIENRDPLATESIDFKASAAFVRILERFLSHYEHKLLPFEDIYYNGVTLATRQRLRSRFLVNRNVPMARRLEHIEDTIWEALTPLRKQRLEAIEKIVQAGEGHDLEVKSFSRLLSLKESKAFGERLHKFTRVSYWSLYQTLFDERLFLKLSGDLELPAEIHEILKQTQGRLAQGIVYYEDVAPLLYLQLKIQGSDNYSWIKQVVIDEAQDYSPLQYQVFKMLFRWADFTVLGDINQSMERGAEMVLYDDIIRILDKKDVVKLVLSKTYRSSYEISTFTQKLLGQDKLPGAFERHDEEPRIIGFETEALMDDKIARDAEGLIEEGFGSVAIICKTKADAQKLYDRLKKDMKVQLIGPESKSLNKGITIIPVYMAKGLEFDAVLVYGANVKEYFTKLDKRLLYIACTRALHRLALYYTGVKTAFLPD